MSAMVRMRPFRGPGPAGDSTGGSATATEDVGVQQSIFLLPASGCGCQLDSNVAGSLLTEGNFHAVNPVDRGVSGGGAAEDLNVGSGKEAQMGEVVAHLLGEFQRLEDCGFTNSEIAEGHDSTFPDRYTTRAVVV